ncbi:hypothetical protein MtrunA17_Chr7g0234161 [Medicago truncatula]|uniref:Transmembrane protein n=1 Tax=Medicago truncatula TaxID=3880 RepID=A0A396GX43_MEDTR|nr:hypothetical protein MtrunA17_Chr7g0234161 [Medicago truncatula]
MNIHTIIFLFSVYVIFWQEDSVANLEPPMDFRVHRIVVPVTPDSVVLRPFVHDVFNFQLTYEKIPCLYDVTAGYLELAEFDFAHMALDSETMVINLVDENGNVWNCSLQFSETPYANFRIGGG